MQYDWLFGMMMLSVRLSICLRWSVLWLSDISYSNSV